MKMHKCSDKKMQLIFFFNLKYTCYLETMAWVETAVALLMSIDGSILIAHSWWEVRLGANAGAKTSGIVLKHAGSGAGWCFLAKQSKIRTLCPSRCHEQRQRGRKWKKRDEMQRKADLRESKHIVWGDVVKAGGAEKWRGIECIRHHTLQHTRFSPYFW